MQRTSVGIIAVGLLTALLAVPSSGQSADDDKKAIPVLKSPAVMTRTTHYRWDATLSETGGKVGFEVRSTDFYILGPDGRKWTNSWSETHKVPAGKSVDVDYSLDLSDQWAGGLFHCVWVGRDDAGNPIRIVQEVRIP